MNRFYKTLFVLFILPCYSCNEDDKVTIPDYPKIKTLEVSNITETGATFNAEFSLRGNFEIESYGFIWSKFAQNITLENSDQVTVYEDINDPSFSLQVSSALEEGDTYYVRAFVSTSEFVVYGQRVEFVSLGSKAPQIEEVNTLQIFYGDTVLISGKNFSFVGSNNRVQFGSAYATVTKATDSLLHVVVPDDITSSESELSVTVAGNKAESSQTLSFIPPVITSISKTEVMPGDTLEVLGSYFGYREELNTVLVDNIEVKPLETDSTKIKLVVPATNETFTISVTNSVGQTATSMEISIL